MRRLLGSVSEVGLVRTLGRARVARGDHVRHPSSLVTRVEQHQSSRGGGGLHQYNGVEEVDHRCAALRGAVGVGQNSGVGEAVAGF